MAVSFSLPLVSRVSARAVVGSLAPLTIAALFALTMLVLLLKPPPNGERRRHSPHED